MRVTRSGTAPLTIAWTRQEARTRALADTVGGTALVIYPRLPGLGDHVLVRYPLSALLTILELLRRRPRAVIVQNPPVFPALIAYAYCRVSGARLVMDTHPAGFGAKDSRQGRLFLPQTRWLAGRVSAVLVTVQSFVRQVESWGGRGVIVHEPPIDSSVSSHTPSRPTPSGDGPKVLFACVFASDEPVAEVVAAATMLPEVEFLITGDPARTVVPVPPMPANVTLTGLIPLDEFLIHMRDADAVLSLTTEATSVARSAYEAVYLRRPLVVSRVEAMVQAFPTAQPCENEARSIASAISTVLETPPSADDLAAREAEARATWALHEADLISLMEGR